MRPLLCRLAAVGVLLTGCSFESNPEPPEYAVDRSSSSTGAADGAVLYDENRELDEGVWALTDQELPRLPIDATASNGLLQEGGARSLWIMAPGLYGGFPTRLISYTSTPAAPPWCEDVVEAPLRVVRDSVAFMGFEDYSDPFEIGSGDFRVRLCASGLDDPMADPEVQGNDDMVSASRFELQIWPAPWAPGEIVEVGSEFARELHARVAAARQAATS